DNEVGLSYILTGLGLPAHNARRDASGLVEVVRKALDVWRNDSRLATQSSSGGVLSLTHDSRLAALNTQ
ncbi:MAG TPA: hypothetical protein VGC48_04155, partial [Gemmatimonadales bacterium]